MPPKLDRPDPIITQMRLAGGKPFGPGNGSRLSPLGDKGPLLSGDSRVSGDFSGYQRVIGETVRFLGDYIVMPEVSILAMAAWIQAAHFIDTESKGPWDQFPLLAVTSPEKRCGKSTLLDLLSFITPRADEGKFINPSPAAFYRAIEMHRPTIIMDESQSLKRRASESSEVIREMLNASIRRDEHVVRCVGDNHEPKKFSIYSPKVFAQIDDPDGVLADRCLPIRLERKTKRDVVQKFRYRVAKQRGEAVRAELERWAVDNAAEVSEVYDKLEPFDIENDRMADLLMPLQAVLIVAGAKGSLDLLERYAHALDERDREQEMQSTGVRLLAACRDVFRGNAFLQTDVLIRSLLARSEEPWRCFNNGNQPITREKLASLLRPYKIRSKRTPDQKQTGYYACDFQEAWDRYLAPANPPNPASPARNPQTSGPSFRLIRNGKGNQ